ncbi:carbohydrate ABC transporter substrate-binding protein [Pseudarthrobacter sp. NIBRBAC000502772]|uniref:ABC transporter substrate-binding protein n=1 Tax=Pseudarthrobacter sp. NIBRBAC000502772 TaxID=2590775 RepID=UPI001130CD35|nr:ABC transporter substrate-binding protein [Pseudarthrobacter sp. NIBRBAC000502772]QDG68445.1 carbohydrate ABC transporter substrate-binding protein [Pseudarthrobacter sp. NIBRBAC000502772]
MRASSKLKTSLAVTAAASLIAVTGCSANQPSGSSDGGGTDKLEITSWWTSGSEADALNVLIDGVKKGSPGLAVDNAAVSGGGGSNARQALAARLQAGSPPDSWQVHPAGQLKSYVVGGQAADLTDLWTEGDWASQLPKDVAEAQQVDGKYYTVPIGVHRGNVLWTNPSVLTKANVTIDPTGDLDALIASLQQVQDSGTTAVCLGDKDIFASSQLLESIIMSRAGADNWKKLFTNEYSFDAPEVKQALEDYKTILALANKDHSAITWDEASKNMAEGDCAVNLMGDWAYGELLNAGKKPGTDFGWVAFPGKEDIFDYVGDGFSIPAKNIPHAEAAKAWLKTLMDPKIQTDFAAKKGSIPALSTADISGLSQYQQEAAASFKSAAVVSSLAHAQASGAEFAQTYADAVSTFNGSGNIAAFTASMTQAQKSQL